ncbi:hypothetical protein QBC44DRAFT_360699 [Cladorrhinum sp. PSN332]|nr:hypothetical protein QBC44DRAFT_360699 [Cladorrhinum sp. PSN332]
MPTTGDSYPHGSEIDQTPYQSWTDPVTGHVQSTGGALLPQNYKKGANSLLPWACPIISCREMHSSLANLGVHFASSHSAARLHDNMDGTLVVVVGHNDLSSHDGREKRPVIMSKSWTRLKDEPPAHKEPLEATSDATVSLPMPRRSSRIKPENRKRYIMMDSVSTPDSDNDSYVGSMLEDKSDSDSSDVSIRNEMATSTRRYDEWHDENGNPAKMNGALIPEGYELDLTNKDRPWVCPIRSCKLPCRSIKGLGYHFTQGHKAAELNDNGDGTLSIVGTHSGARPKMISKSSKKFLHPNEPPIAEAHASWQAPGQGYQKPPPSKRLRMENPQNSSKSLQVPLSHNEPRLESTGYDGSSRQAEHHAANQQVGSRSPIKGIQPSRLSIRGGAASEDASSQPNTEEQSAQTTTEGDVEVENWEKQGGRIVSTKAAWSRDIAYTGAYLAATGTIHITNHVTVIAVAIAPWTRHEFAQDDANDRICTLASGRLEVRVDNEPNFGIGPGGLFKVTLGSSCCVTNVSNTEVILNVTMVQARQ